MGTANRALRPVETQLRALYNSFASSKRGDVLKRTDAGDRKVARVSQVLKKEEQVCLAEMHAEDPSLLLHRFEADLATVRGYEGNPEAFYTTGRAELPPCPTELATINNTGDVQSLAKHLTPFAIGDDVGYEFLDYEIFPLRSTDLGRLDGAAPRRMDLLLASPRGTPVVCEVKYKNDQHAYYALVQALMHTVEVSSRDQLRRIARHYSHLASQPISIDGQVELLLLVCSPPKYTDEVTTPDARSFRATRAICETLMNNPSFSSVISRISYVEVIERGGTFEFVPVFKFDQFEA